MARPILMIITAGSLVLTLNSYAQSRVTPFKLGSFEHNGRQFVGIVLNEDTIIDLTAAHARFPASGAAVTSPADMKDLIRRYEDGWRARIIEISERVRGMPADERKAFVYPREAVKVLPPVMYPRTVLNAAVNYTEHGLEMGHIRDDGSKGSPKPGFAAPNSQRPAGIWEPGKDDKRWTPYMFLKSPSAIIADGEAIRLPPGRPQIDWECELGIVIGKTAKNVTRAKAADYIFGYTIELDVSDREGRGDERYGGSDWLMGKSRDTFAPIGPFITPKEFVSDVSNLEIAFSLNGKLMQQSNTRLMVHDVFEQVVYGSNILTLLPGDIIATGTPSGVGSARTPPIFLKAGDKTSCSYKGVGTLQNVVVPGTAN